MKKYIVSFLFILLVIPVHAQHEYWPDQALMRSVQTGIVFQNWRIDGVEDRIIEGTMPISVIWPINENSSIQLMHSPAVSRFGNIQLSGMSDTWLHGSYIANDRYVFSAGMGLPTGKSRLTTSEMTLLNLLSRNTFRFMLPIYGQGFTLTLGTATAIPVSDKFVAGVGLNYVMRSPYYFQDALDSKFNPGDQFAFTAGLDHQTLDNLRLIADIIITYFTNDKLEKIEVYGAATRITGKIGMVYTNDQHMVWAVARYRMAGKNETWNGTTLMAESFNSNVTERELEAVYSYTFSDLFKVKLTFDARSYVENESGTGQADLFGGGVESHFQLSPNMLLISSFKHFIGDGEYNRYIVAMSGSEFRLSTVVRF